MHFPKFLYKYTNHHGAEILEKLQLKVTPPNQLNDPFELKAYLVAEVTAAHIEHLVRNTSTEELYCAMKSAGESVGTPEQFKNFVAKAGPLLIQYGQQAFQKVYEDYVRDHIDKFSEASGLVCLSETENNCLMWSHYADSHHGMVIEFRCDHIYFDLYSKFQKVNYPLKKVAFDPNSMTSESHVEFLGNVLTTKQPEWFYEAEWRGAYPLRDCITKNGDRGPLYFTHIPKDLITRVILGQRCPVEIENRVRQSSNALGIKIRVQRAVQNMTTMQMEYKDI